MTDVSDRLGKFKQNITILSESTGDSLTADQVFEELDVFFPEQAPYVSAGDRFQTADDRDAVVVQDLPALRGFVYVVLGEPSVEFMKYNQYLSHD